MQHIVIGELDETRHYNSMTNFVFVINNKFYLITYHNMNEPIQDYIVRLINNNVKTSKLKPLGSIFEVSKSHHLNDDFDNSTFNFDMLVKRKCWQLNYYYYDNAGKMYGVMTSQSYKEKHIDSEKLEESYNELIAYLKKWDIRYIEDYATKLMYANISYGLTERKYISRTEDLIKLILQK